LLSRGLLDSKETHDAVVSIERNARSQTQLIEDLLDMSRIISGKMRLDVQLVEPASFIEAALATVRPAATAKEIRLVTELAADVGTVLGDPSRLQQVIWNLLSNAIKFTPQGGEVKLIVRRLNAHLEIIVCDTGQGISADFLPYVFDRFRKADGSTTRTLR
jgi:signal transduction histidine kinase